MILVIIGIQPGKNFIKTDIGTRLVSQNFDIGPKLVQTSTQSPTHAPKAYQTWKVL